MTTAVPDTLLLPVETLNREFDGKLLLALCAAERGLKPIIGGRTAIHDRLPALPRSIYLSKGVRSGSRPMTGAIALSSRRSSSDSPAADSGVSAASASFAVRSASTSGVTLPRVRFSALARAGSITA